MLGHYKIRIIVSLWRMSTPSQIIQIFVKNALDDSLVKTIDIGTADLQANNNNNLYCSNSWSNNFDFVDIFDDSDNLKIEFTSSQALWGLREYTLVSYLCSSVCAKCRGDKDNCTSCTDAKRVPVSGSCVCDSVNGYYKYPGVDYCTGVCPIIGGTQYYGDLTSRSCVS